MNEAVNGTINQISSSSFGWWSSFVCSLHVALFHEAFSLVGGWLAGWVNSHPPPPSCPPWEKIAQGWHQKRRLPLVYSWKLFKSGLQVGGVGRCSASQPTDQQTNQKPLWNRATCKLQTNEDHHSALLDEIWLMVRPTATFMHFFSKVYKDKQRYDTCQIISYRQTGTTIRNYSTRFDWWL